jgi:DNA-binding transcriptional MerR regulator
MSKNALAISEISNQSTHKSKPRYTEAENRLIFESWWNPQKRRELKNRIGREMNALRSQFCRILKEKGLSNQDYYSIMQSKHNHDSNIVTRKRNHEFKEIDHLILETFCRHQAQGNSRTQACDELQKRLGTEFTPAALKLRFYRLVKTLQYGEADLLKIGRELLNKTDPVVTHKEKVSQSVEVGVAQPSESLIPEASVSSQVKTSDQSFFYQILYHEPL